MKHRPWMSTTGTNPDGSERARLIATKAPELYEALRDLVGDLPTSRDWLDPYLENRMRALLAEIEGKS